MFLIVEKNAVYSLFAPSVVLINWVIKLKTTTTEGAKQISLFAPSVVLINWVIKLKTTTTEGAKQSSLFAPSVVLINWVIKRKTTQQKEQNKAVYLPLLLCWLIE